MSRILLNTVCFLFLSNLAVGQGAFAPDGAEWYHDMQFGSFHSKVTGDTTIQGIAAKIITQEGLVKNPWYSQGLQIYALQDIYVQDGGDTVFAYNTIFNKFTPLYVFNVQDGDTLKLPIFPAQGNGYPYGSYTDSLFYTVIDSVRMVVHDTSLLKTFYTRCIGITGSNYRFSWGIGTNGVYAEKVGAVGSSFFPYCVGLCVYVASENAQRPGPLRCYSDNDYAIKLVPDDCANGGITSVGDVDRETNIIKLHPNPADGEVYVTAKNVMHIQATDVTGRIVFSASGSTTISTDQLPDGLYMLKVIFKDRTSHTEKLLIQH